MSSANAKLHDIPKEQDFTDPKKVQNIIRRLRGLGEDFILLFALRWRVNLATLKLGVGENTIVTHIDHWDLHWKLWERFEQVVKHCRKVGATVLLEWRRFASIGMKTKYSIFAADAVFILLTSMDACTD